MKRPLLLIVDMLNDFFRSGLLAERRGDLVRSVNQLVGEFRSREWPVVWVRQEFAADLSDAFLGMRDSGTKVTIAGTDGAEILPELDRRDDDPVIIKKRYSAFYETSLDQLLSSLDPDAIVVAGVNTHACVRMAVIDAYQRDYRVVIARDAVASRNEEYHRVTLDYLSQEIARVSTNAELVESWSS